MTLSEDNEQSRLTMAQLNAIDLLIQGKSDRETAEALGMARETINKWKNLNQDFKAILHQRRGEIWKDQLTRLRDLADKAISVLAEDLETEDRRLRQNAAIHILKSVGIYGMMEESPGTITGKHPRDMTMDELFETIEKEYGVNIVDR